VRLITSRQSSGAVGAKMSSVSATLAVDGEFLIRLVRTPDLKSGALTCGPIPATVCRIRLGHHSLKCAEKSTESGVVAHILQDADGF
jgi:hypothetical protein